MQTISQSFYFLEGGAGEHVKVRGGFFSMIMVVRWYFLFSCPSIYIYIYMCVCVPRVCSF